MPKSNLDEKLEELLSDTDESDNWPEPLDASDGIKTRKYPFHKQVVRGVISDGEVELSDGSTYDYYKLHDDLSRLNENEELISALHLAIRTRKQYKDLSERLKIMIDAQMLSRDDLIDAAAELEHKSKVFEVEFQEKVAPLAQTEFVYFAALICPEEPPTSSGHILYMMELIEKSFKGEEGLSQKVVISIAAGMAKTRTSSVKFSLFSYQYLLGRMPIIIASASKSFLNSSIMRPILSFIKSDVYQTYFNEHAPVDLKRSGVEGIYGANGTSGLIRGVSIGSQFSGIRASVLVLDDVYKNFKDASSDKTRDTVNKWFKGDVISRLLPESFVLAVNTRFFSDDLAGQLISTADPESDYYKPEFKFNSFVIPIMALDSQDPLGRDKNELMWENFYSLDHWKSSFSGMSTDIISTLYFCKPADQLDTFITNEFLSYYYTKYPEDEDDYIATILSIDSASTANERSDFSAFTVWRVGIDGRFYLLECVNIKVEFNELIKEVRLLHEKWDFDKILIEKAASGQQLHQYFKAHRGNLPSIEAIAVGQQSKEFRLDACIGLFEEGKVIFPKQAHWLSDVRSQLLKFPYGQHDDIVDSMSLFLNYANKRYTRTNRYMAIKI